MELFRAKLRDLCHENCENKYFVPQQSLYEVLNRQNVKAVLEDQGIEKQQLDGLALNILQGKRAIFGILVYIRNVPSILRFVETDRFESHDQRLPYSLEDLRKIYSAPTAKEFYEEQWRFIAPIFSKNTLPRILEDRIILPIVEQIDSVDHGGFGDIHKIRLHHHHQQFFDSPAKWCVRKEFKPRATTKADYELELRNLSILNHLKHPNIIEVVTAFSYRGKHNLIFPALSGDLATLLESNRPSSFASDEVIVLALANLASAIEQVHDFSARTIDLREIGCHHDLRPKNILVEGSQFVLADFGLSRFKDTSQDSDTMHKKGQGDYVAPECEDLDGDFSKHRIRRSSDIWSFGCIIAEVLTYMIRGSDGVEQFWKLRTYKVHQNKYHLFHEGPGQPSHAVELWLESLGVNLEKPGRLLLRLVKDMMSLEPDDRPRADEVAGRLRLIVLYYTTESIDVRYDELFNQVENSGAMVEVYIERARYRSWKEACGVTNRDDLGRYTPGFDFDMQLCLSLLAQVKQGLEGVANLHSTPRHLPFLPLRHLSNRLESLLPSMCRGSLQTCLERNVVGETENPAILQVAQELFQNDPINSNIGALASIKRMVFLLENHKGQTRRDMYIESERIQLDRGIADCAIGKIENQQGRPVLVEWVRYEAHLVDEQEGKNRLSRLDGIADFLSQTKVATSVRTLHCSNYFHDPVHLRFGLVFDFPKSPSAVNRPNNSDAEVLTLRQILEKFENRTRFPLLGDRFELALKLAQSIAEFHKADWLHKSISSFHIVFFPPPNVSAIHCLRDPYIVGINDSRPDAEGELTFGPADTEDSAYLDFQHPDYLKHLQRYCREFDYYSLGLVLLEIGLWESLSKMTEGWEGTPANVTKRLLSEKVPRLCRSMGYRYFCVVENCLKGDISAEGIKDGISSITPHLF